MKTLRIYNYEILNFEAEPMIFSASGFTKITNSKMTKALRRLEQTHPKYITQGDLEKLLRDENLQPASAMEFLDSLSILGESTDPPYFQNIIIYHDLDIPEALRKHFQESFRGKLKIRSLSDYKPHRTDKPTLFVLACSKLCPESIRVTYFELLALNPGSGASIGFISANHFHLTEAYLPSIGNHCAFCTLDRIAHYETLRMSRHHWSKVWTFCRKKNLNLPKSDIDELQISLVFGSIIAFTKKLSEAPKRKSTQDQALLSRTVNLDTGAISEDISVHWPLCHCLGFE